MKCVDIWYLKIVFYDIWKLANIDICIFKYHIILFELFQVFSLLAVFYLMLKVVRDMVFESNPDYTLLMSLAMEGWNVGGTADRLQNLAKTLAFPYFTWKSHVVLWEFEEIYGIPK